MREVDIYTGHIVIVDDKEGEIATYRRMNGIVTLDVNEDFKLLEPYQGTYGTMYLIIVRRSAIRNGRVAVCERHGILGSLGIFIVFKEGENEKNQSGI